VFLSWPGVQSLHGHVEFSRADARERRRFSRLPLLFYVRSCSERGSRCMVLSGSQLFRQRRAAKGVAAVGWGVQRGGLVDHRVCSGKRAGFFP